MITIGKVFEEHKKLRREMLTRPLDQAAELADVRGALDALLGVSNPSPAPAQFVPGAIPPPPPGSPRRLSAPATTPSILELRYENKPRVLHLQSYFIDRSLQSFCALHNAIWECREALLRWRRVRTTDSGQTVTDPLIECEETFLKWLIVQLSESVKNPNLPVVALMPFMNIFDKIMSFACLDVGGYSSYAAPLFRTAAKNRCWATSIGQNILATSLRRNDLGQLVEMHYKVMSDKRAECLGFALAAGGCLARFRFKAKFAVVTNGGHQFVVLYRNQGSPVIIDLWLGSIGRHWCWTNLAFYPFSTDFRPLYEMDFSR